MRFVEQRDWQRASRHPKRRTKRISNQRRHHSSQECLWWKCLDSFLYWANYISKEIFTITSSPPCPPPSKIWALCKTTTGVIAQVISNLHWIWVRCNAVKLVVALTMKWAIFCIAVMISSIVFNFYDCVFLVAAKHKKIALSLLLVHLQWSLVDQREVQIHFLIIFQDVHHYPGSKNKARCLTSPKRIVEES